MAEPEQYNAEETPAEDPTPAEAPAPASPEGETEQENTAQEQEESRPAKRKGRFRAWWSAHRPTKRRLIQLYAALLMNANIKGFVNGRIYTGATKFVCTPGLNCYSCPGAVTACPLGALQNALAASGTTAPYYVIGIILLFGLILGRTICGFLCPIGMGQELLYKIPTPKLKKSRYTRILSYLKYVILIVMVVAIPLIYASTPAFCKFICPAGTVGGAVALLSNAGNADLYAMLADLFTWKFALLVGFIVASVFIFRFFCRFFCPLGAIYGFFNKIALLGVKLDKVACVDCGLCVQHCKMDVKHVGDHECINCGECISVCPTKAISWKGSKLFLHASASAQDVPPPSEEKPLSAFLHAETAETPAPAETAATPAAPAVLEAAETAETMVNSETLETPEAPKKSKKSKTAAEAVEWERRRNKWLRVIAWTLALALLVVALVYYNFLAPETNTTVYGVGDRVPDFTLEVYKSQVEAEHFSTLETKNKGTVMVINYWYTTCDPCVEELPEFEEVAESYGEEVLIVAVHSTLIIDPVQKWLDERGWNKWHILFAQDSEEPETYDMLGGKQTFPMTVIVGKDGFISFVRQGKLGKDVLIREIETALRA